MKPIYPFLAVLLLSGCARFAGDSSAPVTDKDAVAQVRQTITDIYRSPLYASGTSKHPAVLHWPTAFKVDDKTMRQIRTIKTFSLQDDTAVVVVEYEDGILATDPETRKVVKIEAIDSHEDVWVKESGKWVVSRSKSLSTDYLFDGKSQDGFPIPYR